MSMIQIKPTQNGVCLFTDMIEWLRSDFEDDPIVDVKAKSTAATASAMIRKDKQMAAAAAAATAAATTTTAATTTAATVAQAATTTENVQEVCGIAMRTRSMRNVTKEQLTIRSSVDTQTTITSTNTESQYLADTLTENGSMLDAMEQLAMLDDGGSSIGRAPSQESWDDLEDLIEKI
jgi:hypothetical protein